MRKAGPILILLIGIFALLIDFFPNLQLPDSQSADGTWRTVATKLGLDLEGGLRVEYQALPVEGKSPTPGDMGVIKDIVERRVNTTGVSEPVVTTQGSDRVVVELPGVTDPEAVRKLVDQTGRPAVDFVLKSQGAGLFSDYTSKNVGSYFAITLDGAVVSAPVIQNAIPNGNVQITGGGLAGFNAKDAGNLVTILKFGSLPFPITALSSETLSATLGSQFLVQTVLAGLIGISLVLLFMLIYYRLPGFVASFALIYYTLVMYAIFRLVPVTLTLAGIAGFVLSVGVAVDANILIFERMKEELRLGKSLPAAVEAGFNRAWNSILDSNVSSLITAGILYWFGSSTIRGFALVLIIGVLVSMFTAITVTRTILRVVVREDWARKASYWGVTEEEFTARPVGRGAARGEARV